MTILQMIARLLGVIQIITGLAVWFGALKNLTALHAALGSLFVLVAWIVAGIALFALSARGIPLLTLAVGAIVLWLGMAQTTMMTGSLHWVVRVCHLLVGLALLGLIEALGKATKRHWAATH